MLRDDVEADLRERRQDGLRLYPAYEDYCFGNVPGTLTSALGEPVGRRRLPDDVYRGVDGVSTDTGRDVDVVVCFLVDGFGLAQWRDHETHPVVGAVEETATVTPLTSVYPSETAAAITTFNTGAYPAEHGVLGWNVYDPELDATFLGLSFEGKSGRDVSDYGMEDAFAVDPIYPDLRDRGVDCRHVNGLDSRYSGTVQHAYDGKDLSTLPAATSEAVREADEPAYVYVYLPQVDAVGHYHGTQSAEYASTVDETWRAVADAVVAAREASAADAEVLVTFAADHGHVDTDPERNVDLTEYDAVVDSLERHGDGSPVYCSGTPRNVELHLQEGTVDIVKQVLEEEIGAFVFDREEALTLDLFGDGPRSAAFERRVGDLVATHPELGMWFGGDVEPDGLEHVGDHGGLHPREMLVPFAAACLEDVAARLEDVADRPELEDDSARLE